MGQMLGRLYKKRHMIQSPADLRLMRQQQQTPERPKKQVEPQSEEEEEEEEKPKQVPVKKNTKFKRSPGRRSFVDTSRLVYLDLHTKNVVAFPSVTNLEQTKEISRSQDGIAKTQETNTAVIRETEKMDVQYVTEHVLLFHVAGETPQHVYQQQVTNVADMLRNKHGDNYVILNLCCGNRKILTSCNSRVEEFGWPSGLAPSLEKLCGLCKSMEHWLRLQCVVVLHSRGELDRIGVAMSAYLRYSGTFEASENTDQQALDRFAMSRFLTDRIGQLQHPSQKRYIEYFGGLLTGAIQVNTNSVNLYHITVRGVPHFEATGGCRAFIRVYQRMLPVFTSAVFSVSRQAVQFIIPVGEAQGIQLRGDILIKCYHRHSDPPCRKLIFCCQFHTCAIYSDILELPRQELDEACYDMKFPLDGSVRFHFVPCKDDVPGNGVVMEDMGDDPILRCDSYDTLSHDEVERESPVCHLQGPLDGSLYATVTKQKQTKCSSPNSAAVCLDTGPHTASMDSGISSHSGLKDGRISGGSTSPPHSGSSAGQPNSIEAKAEVHPQPSHSELDELVSGMLLDIQNIPDLKPGQGPSTNIDDIKLNFDFTTSKPVSSYKVTSVETTRSSVSSGYPPTPLINGHAGSDSVFDDTFNSTTDEADIPYHARQDSKPFSYGMISNSPSLNKKPSERTGLESPVAVRKASFHGTTEEVPKKPGLESPKLIRKFSGGKKPNGYLPSSINTETYISKREDTYIPYSKRTPLEHSYTAPSLYKRSPNTSIDEASLEQTIRELRINRLSTGNVNTGSDAINQSWLQKQQAKLRERQDLNKRYPSEKKLFNELHHRLRSEDGYFSDSTIFSDFTSREGSPTKNGSFSTPLHINTSLYTTSKQKQQQQQQQQQQQNASTQEGKPSSEPNSPVLPIRSSSKDRTRGYQQYQYIQSTTQHRPLGRHHSDTLHDRDRPFIMRKNQDFSLTEEVTQSSAVPLSSSPSTGLLQTVTPNEKRSSLNDRPVTPGFPVTPVPRTPYVNSEGLPPKSPTTQRKDRSPSPGLANTSIYYPSTPRRSSNLSLNDSAEVITHHPLFVKDISRFWYKPSISRDEAITMLKDKTPGTFVVRDSNSFPGAYGLALKVSQPPPNVPSRGGDSSSELVRHFLIEPTNRGVRLKGCSNEPVFGSLSALVYQHSITALALPTLLVLPDNDPGSDVTDSILTTNSTTAQQLLARGAACNLLYLYTMDIESLSGPPAIKKAMSEVLNDHPMISATVVHFNVSDKGITITDNERKLFFRRHYPLCNISHCGSDPDDRRWTQIHPETKQPISSNRVFGFVAKKPPSKTENQCHLFAEYEEGQPATAIIRFICKALQNTSSSTLTKGQV